MNSPHHLTPNTQPLYPNFYQVGASLPVDAPSYVQRQADEEFYQKLQAGDFCYVFNSRQMGKSSLRVQTMQRLQKQGTVCVAIDLTGSGKVTEEQWYGGIVRKLVKDCQLKSKFGFNWQKWWSQNREILSPVQCLSLFIEEVLLAKIESPIVVFVDEIDKVLSQDFSLDDFFALIRFFQNQRVDNPIFQRLTFALLGVATPGDLITDKTQTPFNIGSAIELHGFQIQEVESLIRGLQGRFYHPQKVMELILYWTGGQPFLTQKLCNFMVEESEKDNPRSVEEVVKSRILENWESQDDPEHLRTIKDRILCNEQRAGHLLELYQQIQKKGEVATSNSVEFSELRLSGLVVQREGTLRVYNRVYQQVFNQSWVENQLNNLRPYSENFRAWVASEYSDESRLLEGKALAGAEKWAKGKDLSYQDKQFLAASKQKEIAVRNQEAQLERERKDREAAEQRNHVLSQANIKAKRRIRNSTFVLILALLGAVISVKIAAQKVLEARNKLEETYTYVAYPQQLTTLAGKLSAEPEKASEISKNAAIKIKDPQLEQVYLHASKSLAYQYLKDWKSADESIKQSMKFLRGWEYHHKGGESSSEFLQIKIFALNVQGNLFRKLNNTQKARAPYQEAFAILKKNQISPFKAKLSILNKNTVEDVHRRLIESLDVNNIQENSQLDEVRTSLKNYYLDELNNLLSNKKWLEADDRTTSLMLYLAKREQEGYFDYDSLNNFSCQNLKNIDSLWVKHSDKRFGFSVQKQIWEEVDFYGFVSRVGWYNKGKSSWRSYQTVIGIVEEDYRQAPVGILPTLVPLGLYQSTLGGGYLTVMYLGLKGSQHRGVFSTRYSQRDAQFREFGEFVNIGIMNDIKRRVTVPGRGRSTKRRVVKTCKV